MCDNAKAQPVMNTVNMPYIVCYLLYMYTTCKINTCCLFYMSYIVHDSYCTYHHTLYIIIIVYAVFVHYAVYVTCQTLYMLLLILDAVKLMVYKTCCYTLINTSYNDKNLCWKFSGGLSSFKK